MAFLDKAKELANQAMEKGEEAVAAGKLMLKIKEEEKNIKDFECQIGKVIVEKLDAGEELEEGIMTIYGKMLESRKRIEEYKAEQEKEK